MSDDYPLYLIFPFGIKYLTFPIVLIPYHINWLPTMFTYVYVHTWRKEHYQNIKPCVYVYIMYCVCRVHVYKLICIASVCVHYRYTQ